MSAETKVFTERAPIPVVYQRDAHGCAAGALGMLLGVSYETAKQIIPAHKCSASGCVKCQQGTGRRGEYDYMASALHVVDILRYNGYACEATRSLYEQNVYPVLMKICWDPNRSSAHFVIWDPQQEQFLCSSAGQRSRLYEGSSMEQYFQWSDEPAYIVKHPKFLPKKVKVQVRTG